MIATLLVICSLNLQAGDTLKKGDDSATIVLSVKSASVKEILENLEEQTNFHFFYNHKATSSSEKITMTLDNVSLESALREIGERADLVFKVRGDQIVVKKKPAVSVISMFQREDYFLSKQDIDRVALCHASGGGALDRSAQHPRLHAIGCGEGALDTGLDHVHAPKEQGDVAGEVKQGDKTRHPGVFPFFL